MRIFQEAGDSIRGALPGAVVNRSGACVLVEFPGAKAYVMPESLQGLDSDQIRGLVGGMLWGVQR